MKQNKTLTFKEKIEDIIEVYENDKYTVYFDIEDKVVRFRPKQDTYPRIGEMNGFFDMRIPGGESMLVEDLGKSDKLTYSYALELIEEVKEMKPAIIK